MRNRDAHRCATRARFGIRGLLLAIAAIVSVGCNTCLDVSSVSLDGPDSAVSDDVRVDTVSDASDASDAGDAPDAADLSDTGPDLVGDAGPDACVPLSSEELCEDLERFCGETETVDNCGERREFRCGRCDETNSDCERGRCECDDGWRSVDDGARCVDIDECDIGTDDCDDGVNCTNLPGSFQCSTCPGGYLDVNGDGSECVDIDECSNGSAGCDTLVSCTNLDGSYECGDCPSGYEDVGGDGTDCKDIDECSTGADDCDPNATCTNNSGGFDCACNNGYVGDGTNCALGLVTQVEIYRASLSAGQTSVDVPLSESWDVTQTVPFASVNLSGTVTQEDAEFSSAHPDVFLSEPTVLRITREDVGYDMRVVVTLVEFDPASTSVQTGSYSVDATSEQASISSVAPGHSLLYFTTQADSADRFDELMTRAEVNASAVTFRRDDGSDRVSGHWWVVEATGDQFDAEQYDAAIADQQKCTTVAINTVDPTASVLLWSTTVGNTDRVEEVHAACELQGGSAAECCRDTGGNSAVSIALQVIEFVPETNIVVERGQERLSAGDPLERGTVSMARDRTMPLLGSIGVIGMSRIEGSTARVADGMTTVDFNRTAQTAEVERGAVTGPATTPWQVVHWYGSP